MQNLSPEGLRILTDIARHHGVSLEATVVLLDALVEGNGRQAQFSHPDLGGMGQWSQGGMVMVGDMFNQGLKHRVDMLCNEIAGLSQSQTHLSAGAGSLQAQSQNGGVSLFVSGSAPGGRWWPPELGAPASVGAQNDLRYAFFPGPRRLAIKQGGEVRVFDSGEHLLSGFSQQQGADQSLTFTSQFGLVRVADLPLVAASGVQPEEAPRSAASTSAPSSAAPLAAAVAAPVATPVSSDVLTIIERLAELRQKNILTEEEFAAKKAELLSRL